MLRERHIPVVRLRGRGRPADLQVASTSLTVRAVSSYRRKYSDLDAFCQNSGKDGSFHTSTGHVATSARPYRPIRCFNVAATNAFHSR